MKIHELKCDPTPFSYLWGGEKTAEFRKNDRDFQVFDKIRIWENGQQGMTGRCVTVRVTHVQVGYGIPDGYAMISIAVVRREQP